jgi:hypothetical protein
LISSFKKQTSLKGPLHVLWKVSFGCWVTWSISSWQECYKSVFFFNFTKLQFLNDKIYSFPQKNYLALGNLILSFKNLQDWKVNTFLVRSKFERIESIHFGKSSGLSWWETGKGQNWFRIISMHENGITNSCWNRVVLIVFRSFKK